MPEPENPARRSLYDREVEFQPDETHPGRRHRQIPDWGGDELFARMPRRRSLHDGGQRSRRFAPADGDAAQRSRRFAAADGDAADRSGRFAPADGDAADRSGRFAPADGDAADRSRRFAASGADEPARSRAKRRRAADDWGLELLSDPPSSTAGDAPEQRRPDSDGTSEHGPEPHDADPGWVLGLGADEREGDDGVRAVEPRSAP